MSFWTAIVVIVLIVSVTQMLRARHNSTAGDGFDGVSVPRAGQHDDDAEKERLRAEIDELKDRIKVLERIATDDRQKLGLAEEIELLREK